MINYSTKDVITLLEYAEMQYKFALAIQTTFSGTERISLAYLSQFSWGDHITHEGELDLTHAQERKAAAILVHSAIYIMAVQMDSLLKSSWGKTIEHVSEIKTARNIVRIIRNAFSHDPLAPVWLIDRKDRNKQYEIPKVITIDTTALNGKPMRKRDYGGELALLRLLQYLKQIAKNSMHKVVG